MSLILVWFDPSASITQMSGPPAWKAIFSPWGENAGELWAPGETVSLVSFVPSASIT